LTSYFRGEFPHVSRFRRVRCGALYIALVATSLVFATGASAEQAAILTLADAEQLALHNEPGQTALLSRASALREQAVAARQLPDPKLRVALANFPIESGGFSTEGMTQAQLGLRQSFPRSKTRAAGSRRFQALALEMSESADARRRDVLAAVRKSWLEAYYWTQARKIVAELRPLFSDLVTITESLYSVGRKDQQDLLRAELELSRVDDRLIGIDQHRAMARASLNQWIGSQGERPLGEQLPDWQPPPPIGQLHAALVQHPSINAVQAQIAATRAGVTVAEQSAKPGWALDVAYAYRDGSLPAGTPRSDFVTVAVTVDLPYFRKNRHDRKVAAALKEQHAADATQEALLRRLTSQLEREYVHWRELTRRIELYERVILAKTREQSAAALAAYQSESADFADVMQGSIDELNTQLDYLRLQVDRGQSHAVLAELGGLLQ